MRSGTTSWHAVCSDMSMTSVILICNLSRTEAHFSIQAMSITWTKTTAERVTQRMKQVGAITGAFLELAKRNLTPEQIEEINRNTELSYEEQNKLRCDRMNTDPGKLEGYDCPDCLNRGGSYVVRGDSIVFRICHCDAIRKSLQRVKNSGLADMLDDCTFEAFRAVEDWQKVIKQSAVDYVTDSYGKWFFVGGQVGAGKTHLCTAIVGELLKQGKSARYMLWRDEVVQLKASVTDDWQYAKLINPLKSVDVLYIDDFLKTPRNKDGKANPPTAGDLNVAFELLNHRYNNKNLVTIISCEHYMDDLIKIDEAVGSRIYQRTKEYSNHIGRDMRRNYRVREEVANV